jgi:hypothetical protein
MKVTFDEARRSQRSVIAFELRLEICAAQAGLWNVEHQSTTVLMESLYRHLAGHEDKATALARAKRDFLERSENISAYYWVGFVIVGEGAGEISFGV